MVKGWTVVALLSAIGALMLLSISKIPDVIHKPGHDLSRKRIGSHSVIEDDASEFRSDDGIFPRAREWHDYWTYASRKGEDRLDESHVHDAYVALAVKSASAATLRHINDMKQRYESAGALPDFYARGIGWIQERLNMVLTVVVAGDFANNDANDDVRTLRLHSGPTTIFIVDTIGSMKCGGEGDSWIDVQPPLTLWVRANGMSPSGESEIFAGTALPHNLESFASQCAWRYDFVPKNAGFYSIHVKVLNFNGFVDSLSHKCPTRDVASQNDMFDGQIINKSNEGELETLEAMNYDFVTELAVIGNYSHHRGVSGFKMYHPIDACCEACKRSRNCKMFSIPGALHYDDCELFFDRIEDDVDFSDRNDGHYLGRDRNYSYTRQNPDDFPSIRRKRKLVTSSSEINKPFWPVNMHPLVGSPTDGKPGEATYFIGCGWSSMMTFESPCHYPSDDLVFGSGQKIEVIDNRRKTVSVMPTTPNFSANGLRACLLDDEKLDVSDGRWVRYPYPDDSVCRSNERDGNAAEFDVFKLQYFGDQNPICWHRDDLTQIANTCAEQGCKFIIKHRWVTDLKRDAKWFGWWKSYNCEYQEMGDEDIQQCVDRKKISKIEVRGASISKMVKSYMIQKLQNIKMTDTNNIVVLDTLKLSHLLWDKTIHEHRDDLQAFPNMTADSGQEYYFMSGLYYTSEREPHIQVDRSLLFSKIAYDTLTPKGYKMINALDVTAAFAFDTDGQADGLHIGGPPIKVIVTKFFHHLCHEVISRSEEGWKN